MSDLNEVVQTVVRKQWDRAYKIRIDNEIGKPPKIVFEIQTVTSENGEIIGTKPKSLLKVDYDPTAKYPLINPLDNSVIAEAGGNHDALQVQLYSLFRSIVKW